jgi:hypothetical protein
MNNRRSSDRRTSTKSISTPEAVGLVHSSSQSKPTCQRNYGLPPLAILANLPALNTAKRHLETVVILLSHRCVAKR